MTKQQNRARGFGKRSLSVVLSVLMILSVFAVMLSATSLPASAAISYWQVAGNFNDWGSSLNNTTYRINGGSGTVTFPLTASSITFKMVAYENSNSIWCGNSSGSATVGSESELIWSGGNDITCALPANTVSVTFTLSVKNNKNYVTVTASTSGGGGTPTPSGNVYTAKVNENNSANSKDAIFWADATYYDYLSDKELSSGWLNPDHVGTSNFNGNIDEWYPFFNFNRSVVKAKADSNSSWSKPLYFGNFCNTYKAYDTSHHPGVTNGYSDATGSNNVTRFNYAANNSNGVYDRYTSVQGLMGSALNADGKLVTADGTVAPYFDESSLGDYAKIVKSKFPFRKQDMGTYMRYEFDSTNARDNVYFDWSGSTPTAVNYGAGTSYGVKDGIKEFMNTDSGYGIFPFNRPAGQSNGGNNELDYGFGIRMDMKFRVPTDTEVKFDFSGDDDLWMYITDTTTGVSQLILDMGGSHKESEGEVNFTTKTSTVYKVDNPGASNKDIWIMDTSSWGNILIYAWDDSGHNDWYYGDSSSNLYRFRDTLEGKNTGKPLGEMVHFLFAKNENYEGNSGDLNISDRAGRCSYTDNIGYTNTDHVVGGHCEKVTNPFDFDPSHTYTMTIFYMERGLIESNCKMGFTLTPLGNNFIVTEDIQTTGVNESLQDIVKQLSSFGFKPYKDDNQLTDDYADFELGDNGSMQIPDSSLEINSDVKVQQYAPATSYLVYDTSWKYYDNTSNPRKLLGQGTGVTSNGVTTITEENTIINESGDLYDFAELQVDYVNTPQIGSFSVTKEIEDSDGSDDTEFPMTIWLQFDSEEDYQAYTLTDTDGNVAQGGKIALKDGETVTFEGVPIGTHVYVVEDDNDDYTPGYGFDKDNPLIVGTNGGILVTNSPNQAAPITMDGVSGTKTLDGEPYTGDMFNFVFKGIPRFDGDADYYIDTSATRFETNEVVDGVFTFNGLTFSQAGVYRYYVYEDKDYLTGLDAANLITTSFHTDFECDPYEFLVSITVTENNHVLSAGNPVYYPYSSKDHTMTADDFDYSKSVSKIEISNTLNTGNITVNKTNQKGEKVSGVQFAVYKVNEDMDAYITSDNYTDSEKYDILLQQIALSDDELLVGTGTTDENGVAHIDNIPIYQDGFVKTLQIGNETGISAVSSDFSGYQQYVLLEIASNGTNGYSLNKTVSEGQVFSFPINGQYDFTFNYINNQLKNPSTAGPGMTLFKTLGIGIAALALLSLGGYMLYTKRFAKRKTAKRTIR